MLKSHCGCKLARMDESAGTFHCARPSPALSEFVDFLWSCEGYVPPQARERLLPSGTMELAFRLDDDGRMASGVVGVHSTFLVLDTSKPFSVIGVHFKAGGAFPFFGVPSDELHNRNAALDEVWGRGAALVRDQLWETVLPEHRFRVLERALLARARGALRQHPGIRHAVRLFDASNGMRPVSDAVDRIGMSERRFVDLFRAQVGVSPKLFCRIRRFNAVLKRIESRAHVDWLDIALSCGYFDQAHFNHDFHAFSGINPSTYLRHRASPRHVADPLIRDPHIDRA